MDDDDVEDVLQEVWIAALRKRPWRFRVLGAWLTRVARNLAIRSRRDRHLRATREQNAAHTRSLPLHDMDAQRQEVLASVTRAASTLKEPYKTVIALRFFEGLTIGEISDQLETPYDTVRSRLKSALVQMRAMLKRELGKERASWCLGLLSLLPESEWASVAGKTGALATSAEGAAVLAAKAKIVIAVMVCCGALAVFWGSRTRTLPSELPTTRSSIQPRVETAVAPTKTTTAAPVTETAPGQKPAPIPPDVMKQAYIHGIVTDLNGRPVSGATVRASRALNSMFGGTRNKVFTTRSNEKGEYFLGPLVDGAMGRGYRWWVVEASSPGFFKKRRPACQGVELDFQLGPPARLTGCVTHAMDGRPSARAEVTVISRAFSDECKSILYFKELHQLSGSVGPRWKKATDENGSFDFGDLPPGWYSLSVYPTDRKPYTADPEVELLAGVETRTSLVLPVYKKVRVTGRVLDRETGAPVKGYTLASAANPNQQAVTDEDGRYEIRGLGREQNTITGSGAGFVSGRKDMVFVTQSVHEQDFRPGRWARIRGRVLGCDGVPLAGAQVGCNQFAAVVDTSVTARTDEHGIFDHRKALFGKGVRIYAAAGGHAIGISDEMDIQPGEVKTDIEIHLTRGGTVEGRIEDMAGQPVLDGALILRDMKTADKPLITPWIYLHPSDRGRFRFEHVPPGTYMVVGKSAENIRPYTAIQVLEGGTTSVVLTPRRGERIAGRIQNEAGRPLPGVQVQARVASCRAIGPKIYTLPDGTFRFDGIQRGVYDLLLNTPGYFSKILENIRTGNTDI